MIHSFEIIYDLSWIFLFNSEEFSDHDFFGRWICLHVYSQCLSPQLFWSMTSIHSKVSLIQPYVTTLSLLVTWVSLVNFCKYFININIHLMTMGFFTLILVYEIWGEGRKPLNCPSQVSTIHVNVIILNINDMDHCLYKVVFFL